MGRISAIFNHARTVNGVQVIVTELRWHDHPGRSFEVHRVDNDEDLTVDECFDAMPTDQQIATLLEADR